MSKEEYAKSPLLYVQQSDISKPRARMQRRYQSYAKDRSAQQQQSSDMPDSDRQQAAKTPIRRSPLRQSPLAKRPVADETTDETSDQVVQENEHSEEQSPEPTKDNHQDKQFNDMTIEEKVSHLTNRSSHAPALRCEVTTKERSYRGVLIKSEDDQVLMQVGRRSSTTSIPLADIQTIRLLGLM